MSRAQKNVRLRVGPTASTSGSANQTPPDVTEKDGSANIAGTVTNFQTDDYGPETRSTEIY